MKREEAMQILQIYKDEIEQRIDEADAPDVKDVYRWQMDGFCMAIKALSAEAVQGWIPCSERLPSEDGCYLVCMSWEYENMEVLRWVDGWNCHRGYDGKISRENEIDGADITAWMPLPKPYKGGDTE